MLTLISSAKTLGIITEPNKNLSYSSIQFPDEAVKIVKHLKSKSINELTEILETSLSIAQKSYEYNANWKFPFDESAQAAAFMFQGTVYNALDINTLTDNQIDFIQSNLRILSAAYGILKPLDLILPIRLEMANKISGNGFKNLYDFWSSKITNSLIEDLKNSHQNTIINLASNEYFKTIEVKKLKAKIITPEFKDFKNGKYKTLVVYTKRARGLMARFIAINKITDCENLKLFEEEGYYYNHNLSTETHWIFTRG